MEMPPLPRRKIIRLQNYDYSQAGAYFVTICTAHRSAILGNIIPPTSHAVGAGPRPARLADCLQVPLYCLADRSETRYISS